MSRSWNDLFITDGDGAVAAAVDPQATTGRASGGMFSRLRESLGKTRQALSAELRASLFDTLDSSTWERLEEILIYADVGASTTAKVVGRLEAEVEEGAVAGGEEIMQRLRELLAETATVGEQRIDLRHKPTVIMVAGVNGTGKTTTIGKIAWHLQKELGHSVLLGAADTFRAAATEQLAEWAQRSDAEFVRGQPGSDPGAVAFDAVGAAISRGVDVALIDTAGRLHTQENLLDELKKVRRVIEKQYPGAPHETLLVIDATTGQNGVRQAKMFAEAVDVTGIVLTKLDGSAKGGIALAIAQELGIPVKMIGIGEQLEDLRPFDATDFANALTSEAS
ncbi:MAG: signal recognition particle-docking protein FtsY [Thermoleophilaceae bacterium]|nr:signal recognition particle-docking protein FtsY [Thermoleophilaceae bacterium]